MPKLNQQNQQNNQKTPANNYAFIDGQNLNMGVQSLGWKLDYKKFRDYLQNKLGVSRAYMFIGFLEEQQALYNALQEAGFILVFKPLIRHGGDSEIKGNVDAELVLQTMIDIDRYDQAVIVTGDGDFAGLIRHLMSINKLSQIIIPNKDKYSSLFDRLEEFDNKHATYMSDIRKSVEYPSRRRNYKKSQKSSSN
ncbi:MAG: NYN domain-containing protein [Candidatus Saccharimonadales bacterium]